MSTATPPPVSFDLQRFGAALSHFRTRTSATVPSQILQAFLAVASNEGLPLNEYAKALGTSMSTASRQFMGLTERTLGQFVGFGLIAAQGNEQDLRKKGFWLTDSGRTLRDEMLAILND